MKLHDQIRAERERRGLSQETVAKAVGISQPAYRKIESGETIKSRYLSEVLALLGMDKSAQTLRDPEVIMHRQSPNFIGNRDLPVFAAVEGGAGEIVIDTDPIEIVARPWYVQNVKEAYAVLVVGTSMIPEFRPGRLAIVNPKLPPLPGEPAIFVNRQHGEFRATIKELVKSNSSHWVVLQHNPPPGEPGEFQLAKADWSEAYRVVGAYYR